MRSRKKPQVIRADESYSLAEFCERVGAGDHTYRELRKAGLKIRAFGQKRFVLGADWLEFVERLPAAQDQRAAVGELIDVAG